MPFTGFGPQAIPFFKALAFHQTKDWFEANRAIYDGEIKGPLGDLVEELAARFVKAKIPLKGDRKASLFRINRDVRFAKDKSPYKTNSGAVLSRTGAKNDPGMLYFHVSAEGCFAAAGFWHPEPDALARLRAGIARAPKAWKTMVAKLAEGGLALEPEHALTRAPRGFEFDRRRGGRGRGPHDLVHRLARYPRRPARQPETGRRRRRVCPRRHAVAEMGLERGGRQARRRLKPSFSGGAGAQTGPNTSRVGGVRAAQRLSPSS